MSTSLKRILFSTATIATITSLLLLTSCSKHRSIKYVEEGMGPIVCEPRGAVSPNRNDSIYRYYPAKNILTVRQPGIKPHTFISYDFTVDGKPSSTCFQINEKGVTKMAENYCQNNQNTYMRVAGIAKYNPNNKNIRISPATISMNIRVLGLHQMNCNTSFIILRPA